MWSERHPIALWARESFDIPAIDHYMLVEREYNIDVAIECAYLLFQARRISEKKKRFATLLENAFCKPEAVQIWMQQ